MTRYAKSVTPAPESARAEASGGTLMCTTAGAEEEMR